MAWAPPVAHHDPAALGESRMDPGYGRSPAATTFPGAPERLRSDVVAEHQLLGVGAQIDLIADVRHVEAGDVVIDQRDGHDQRHEPARVVVDQREQSSRFSAATSRSLKKPTMCCNTLTCFLVVARTVSPRMKASP